MEDPRYPDGDYWLSLQWGTGLVRVRGGVITETAPIFHRMVGWKADAIAKGASTRLDNWSVEDGDGGRPDGGVGVG